MNSPPSSTFPGSLGFPWEVSVSKPVRVERVSISEPLDDKFPGKTVSMCQVLMGIIILLLVCWVFSNRSHCATFLNHRMPHMISSMRAVATRAPVDHHIKVDDALANKSKVHNLTPCDGEHCRDIKNVNGAFRKACDNKLIEFLNENPTTMIMIFAPWCGHCVNAMPKFYEASMSSDVPFAVVNAEMVSPELLQGERALFNVQFFPFIVRRERKGNDVSDSVFKEAPTFESLRKHASMSSMDQLFA